MIAVESGIGFLVLHAGEPHGHDQADGRHRRALAARRALALGPGVARARWSFRGGATESSRTVTRQNRVIGDDMPRVLAVLPRVLLRRDAAAPAQTKVKVGALKLTSSAPLFVGVEKGFFKEFGVEPELVFFQAAAPIATALAAGPDRRRSHRSHGRPLQHRPRRARSCGSWPTRAGSGPDFPWWPSSSRRSCGIGQGPRDPRTSKAEAHRHHPARLDLPLPPRQYPREGRARPGRRAARPAPGDARHHGGAQGQAGGCHHGPPAFPGTAEAQGFGKILAWAGDLFPWQIAAIFYSKASPPTGQAVAFMKGYVKASRYYFDAALVQKEGRVVPGAALRRGRGHHGAATRGPSRRSSGSGFPTRTGTAASRAGHREADRVVGEPWLHEGAPARPGGRGSLLRRGRLKQPGG